MYMGTIAELGIALADLVETHADWSRETFGSDSERGPVGSLKHLEKEAREAVEFANAGDVANLKVELADCLLLLLDASRRAGVKPMQLIEAEQAKMVVNKQRKWGVASATEPVEHVREEN